ncbi:MAG: type I polyketide synthase, partial [Myxococcota bacterium]
AVGPVPPDRWDPDTIGASASGKVAPRTGGFVTEVDRFDPELFGIAAREARAMDPQQRLLLEVAYAALEDAGQAPDQLADVPVGVYVGMGLSDWARRTFGQSDPARIDAWSGTGVFDSVAAGRIAYTFGLTGPAMAVHTACSSSLVAIHLACRALRERECSLALAGGVNLLLSPEPTLYFAELAALSPTGRCHTFDAAADGYVRGEGCGLLVLKRLSEALADGDEVLAVICGSATNQDGRTTGLTAPSGRAQAAVIRAALADAGLPPEAIGYIEAHGTGTPLGDPIEVGALAEVFRSGEVWVGSGKTQLGHLEAAAGVAGVIRAIAALNAGRIPPHLHLDTPNPRIRLDGTPLRFAPPTGAPWTADRRVAGVSAFGLSGTNAHLVLAAPPPPGSPAARAPFVAVSARTEIALRARVDQVRAALDDGLEPAAVARAFTDGRAVHRWRASFWLGEGVPAAPVAHEARRAPELVFAFTGQGSQRVGMGRGLYAAEPAFRAAMDAVEATYRAATGTSLLAVLHGPPDAPIDDTRWTQPALFAIEWSLAELYRSWGVVPDAVLGHSVGEIVAATVAGVMTLEQAMALVVARAEGLAQLPPGGAMVAVRGPAAEIAAAAGEGVAVAAYNAPDEVVLSGDAGPVHAAAEALRQRGFTATPLAVSHAFHSHRVAPAAPGLAAAVDGSGLRPPRIPLYSAVTGALADGAVTTGAYWADHLVRPVRFADAVTAAVRDGHTTFVELGPRPILCGLGARIAPETTWVPTLHPDHDDRARVYAAVGALFERGARPAFRAMFDRGPRAAATPYPFARERLWIDPPAVGADDEVGRYRVT